MRIDVALNSDTPVKLESARFSIRLTNLDAFVAGLDEGNRHDLIRAMVDVASGDFIDALEDHSKPSKGGVVWLVDGGTLLMQLFITRAEELGFLPEPEWVTEFRLAAEQLQRLIAERDTDAALDLLAELVPGLLSPAAAKMVGGFTGERLL